MVGHNALMAWITLVLGAVWGGWAAAEEGPRVQTSYISMEVQTPHVAWARPYQPGRIRAIILKDGVYQREIIELAERLDLDLGSTYLYPVWLPEAIPDFYGVTTQEDVDAGLERLLREKSDWEVMVLPGPVFKYFKPEQRRDVLEKVRSGRGLVLIDPDGTAPQDELSPLKGRGEAFSGKWKKEKDHYVTAGIPFDALPETECYEYDAVAEGAEVLASCAGKPLVAVRQYGQGRIVAMAYWAGYGNDGQPYFCGLIPHMNRPGRDLAPKPPFFPYHEYHFSMLARAVIWAAKKEPAILLGSIGPEPAAVKLEVTNRGPERQVNCEVVISDRYGDRQIRQTVDARIAPGASSLRVPLPGSPRGGLNLVDVFLRDEKSNVIDWGSASLVVQSPARIEHVEADRPFFRPGDPVNLEITLAGEIDARLSLVARLIDGNGRLIAEQTLPAVSKRLMAAMRLEHPLNRLLVVETALRRNQQSLDTYRFHAPVEFPIRSSAHRGDPYYLGWSVISTYGMNDYLVDSYNKLLAGYGFDSIIVMDGDVCDTYLDSLYRRNMRIQRRGGMLMPPEVTGDPSHPQRKYCLNDPDLVFWRQAEVRANISAPGVYAIQGGDEGSYSGSQDVCFCPHCMAAMRTWLRKEYGNLAALNEEWGTSFGKWEDVKPLTLKECRQRDKGNYAPWCDHRTFGEITLAGFVAGMDQAARAARPGGRYGLSGNPSPGAYCGYDYWLLKDASSMLDSYIAYDELNCWADERFDIRKWAQPRGDLDDVRGNMWYHLLHGVTGLSLCGTQHILNLDWTDARTGKAFREIYRPIQRGIGRLLVESRLRRQPIAMHYSRNASRVAEALEKEKLWEDVRWYQGVLVEQAGFDNAWISYQQLEEGRTGDYRIILLPMSCSLSAKEAAALRAFVEGGGVLIGELAPGIADGHGRMLERGQLDDVFGIRRAGSRIVRRRDRSVPSSSASSMELSFPEMPLFHLETGITPETATVLAVARESNVPVAFANRLGKGLAVYVAADLSCAYGMIHTLTGQGSSSDAAYYLGEEKGEAKAIAMPLDEIRRCSGEAERFLAQCMRRGGVQPVLDLTGEDGQRIRYTKTARFTNGQVEYFGLLRDAGMDMRAFNGARYIRAGAKLLLPEPAKATIRFPTKGYVHEVLSGEDFGLTDTVSATFTPTSLRLFSVSPCRVAAVEVMASAARCKPGDIVRFRVRVKADGPVGNHPLRVNVIDPSGWESDVYSRNLSTEDGSAEDIIPLALNDAHGQWLVRVMDLTSGVEGEAGFMVE